MNMNLPSLPKPLEGMHVAFLSNRSDEELKSALLRVTGAHKIDWIVLAKNSVDSLCQSLKHGKIDVILLANGFLNTNAVLTVVAQCKKDEVLFILVDHGRVGQVVHALEKHRSQIDALRRSVPPPPQKSSGVPVVSGPASRPRFEVLTNPSPSPAPSPPPQLPRTESQAHPQRWSPEELAYLKIFHDEGHSSVETQRLLSEKTGRRIDSNQNINTAYSNYFGKGRLRLGSHGLAKLTKAERILERLKRGERTERSPENAPIPAPTAPVAAVSPIRAPVAPVAEPTPQNAPRSEPAQAKIAVRREGESLLVELSGPSGSSIIETKRTLGEIISWLMGA